MHSIWNFLKISIVLASDTDILDWAIHQLAANTDCLESKIVSIKIMHKQ